eukprot:1026824_1
MAPQILIFLFISFLQTTHAHDQSITHDHTNKTELLGNGTRVLNIAHHRGLPIPQIRKSLPSVDYPDLSDFEGLPSTNSRHQQKIQMTRMRKRNPRSFIHRSSNHTDSPGTVMTVLHFMAKLERDKQQNNTAVRA